MDPRLLEWAFVALLIVAVPLLGRQRFQRLRQRINENPEQARREAYRYVLIEEWLLSAIVLALVLFADRTPEALGLRSPQGRWAWLGLGLTGLACILLLVQHLAIRRNPRHLELMRDKLGSLRDLLPLSAREAQWFRVLSLTAGLCEEWIYRGFLMVVLGEVLALPVAFVAANLIFGLAHLYQGPMGILKTALVGAILGAIALLSGSLWPAMLVHAAIDWNSGELGRLALTQDLAGEPTSG